MSTTPPAAPAPLDPLTIAAGSVPVIVRQLDGTVLTVHVRLLKISELVQFLALIDDEESLAEFLVNAAPGWIAGVSPDSILDIVEKGMELNFTLAKRFADRRLAVSKMAAPFQEFAGKQAAITSASSAPTSG